MPQLNYSSPFTVTALLRTLSAGLLLLGVAPLTQAQGVTFTGMCDASGAIALSPTRFAVADDEDNVLRIYDAERGGAPLSTTDISRQLGLPEQFNKKGQLKTSPETDIEAATILDNRAYWISSHGRNAQGKHKPERMRFFTTNVPTDKQPLQVTAVANERFFTELLNAPQLQKFALAQAATRAPKEAGGLNIEGLTAMPDGRLLIGFRNPIPQGLALLVPLENPQQVMNGQSARFGAPIQLDLKGLGIRALLLRQGQYLIVAGHYDNGAVSKLYAWDGQHAPVPSKLNLTDINPEAFFSSSNRLELMLLSDDGSRLVDGKECKRLNDSSKKSFRGVWATLD